MTDKDDYTGDNVATLVSMSPRRTTAPVLTSTRGSQRSQNDSLFGAQAIGAPREPNARLEAARAPHVLFRPCCPDDHWALM